MKPTKLLGKKTIEPFWGAWNRQRFLGHKKQTIKEKGTNMVIDIVTFIPQRHHKENEYE